VHASDCFDCKALGFDYDDVPQPRKPQMREPPFLAVFEHVNVAKMGMPRVCYVYVRDQDTSFTFPTESKTREALCALPGFAGMGAIFFIDNPSGCTNCMTNPTFDLAVDVTGALRTGGILPSRTVLEVIVENADNTVEPLAATPVPVPVLRGPTLGSGVDIAEGKANNDVHDVKALQRRLGLLEDGDAGPVTGAAIKQFQKAAGLVEDGCVGPKTRATLAVTGLGSDMHTPTKLVLGADKRITWSLDEETVPGTLTDDGDEESEECKLLAAEMQKAFDQWGAVIGVTFELVDGMGELVVAFADRSEDNAGVFDGPGGALADASPEGITFDSSEMWERQDTPHPQRTLEEEGEGGSFWADASIFSFFVVALHEVGHVIGLDHSDDPADVMSPYYKKGQLELSPNDVARAKALYE